MSREIKTFQSNVIPATFRDDLNDSSIHSAWTQDIVDVTGPDPTIAEDGTSLTISYVGGQSQNVYWNTETAPCVRIRLHPLDFTAKVYVSNVLTTASQSGGIVHFRTSNKDNYNLVALKNDGGNPYMFGSIGGNTNNVMLTSETELWVALTRRNSVIRMCYSTNDLSNEPDINSMTYVYVDDHPGTYHDWQIGLFAESYSVGYPAIDIKFQKFSLVYHM
jgi:hypothetical protein